MGGARDADHFRDAHQPVVGQGGVGGLQRHVGAAAHGDADVGGFHRRGVVDAVADHRRRAQFVQLGNRGDFIFRQQTGTIVEAQLAGDRRGGARVVPGQHHAANTQRVQFGYRLFGVAAQRIAQRQQADGRAVCQHHHRRFTGVFQLVYLALPLCGEQARRQLARRADQHGLAVHDPFHTDAGQRAARLRQRQLGPAGGGAVNDRLRQRVM